MTDAELATIPRCPTHGPMALRERPDKTAVELGTWYDCRHGAGGARRCHTSALLPAPWLAEQYRHAAEAVVGR